MAVQLQMDRKGAAYIPESDSWMYGERKSFANLAEERAKMDLLEGIEQQKRLCAQLVDRIKKGQPCDSSRSMQNLSLSILAFKRDIALAERVDSNRKEKAHLVPWADSLLIGKSGYQIILPSSEELLSQIEYHYSQIPFIALERKLEVLQKSTDDLKRNLMLAVTVGVVAIACAKFYFT